MNSLTLAAAAETTWDVVVAGAGPAGALAAHQLAVQGARVLLVDKAGFPREKVCGSCLNGAALQTLAVAGLDQLASRLGAMPLETMQLRAGRHRATLRLGAGVALSRKALDGALVAEAVAKGASFLAETTAQLEAPQAASEKHRVHLTRGDARATVVAKVAVSADGLAGGFLRHWTSMVSQPSADSPAGLGVVIDDETTGLEPGTIYMTCARGGYVGMVRLEDGRLDIAAAVDREVARSGGAAAAVVDIVRRGGFPLPKNLEQAVFRGTPHLTRLRTRVAAARLFVIGDAAGYVEPFTGEGMSWAMQQAVLVAPLAMQAVAKPDQAAALAEHWQQMHTQFFRRRRAVCKAAGALRRNFAWGKAAVAVLGYLPALAGPWVRAVNRPDREVLRT